MQNAASAAIASEIQTVPLPNVDGTVLKRLKANEPELVWNLMLRQAALYQTLKIPAYTRTSLRAAYVASLPVAVWEWRRITAAAMKYEEI